MNFIFYLISSLMFGISFSGVDSMRTGRMGKLSSLITITNRVGISMEDSINRICRFPTAFNANISEIRSIISPLIFISTIFFPLSSTLAVTVDNYISSSSESSSSFLSASIDPEVFPNLSVLIAFIYALCGVLWTNLAIPLGLHELETSVIKLQIGLNAEKWSCSDTNDMSQTSYSYMSKQERGRKLSKTALALLRRQDDWNSASLDSRIYRSFSLAELEYHRLSLIEQSKIQISGTSNIKIGTTIGTTISYVKL